VKKQIAAIFIILGLGIFTWAQAPKDFFDGKKSQTELEIMKGILNTTISYVSQGKPAEAWSFSTSSISAYYLYGQGAVFVIPTSEIHRFDQGYIYGGFANADLSDALKMLKDSSKDIELKATEMALQSKLWAKGFGTGTGSGKGAGKGEFRDDATPMPPAAPTPPVPPVPPAPSVSPAVSAPNKVDREELRKKIEEVQAKLKKSREEANANREKFLKSLDEIKGYLIEALANYGDSLTTVKPNEYINLILSTDNFDTDFSRRKPQHDVISAQKSWITDYKAGRLSLDGFKQKVLQYTE
jgi:hypothetical protein